MSIYMPNWRRMITRKGVLGFLSLFRYDIIYIKVRHKWFWSPDFASRFIELKKRSDFYVGPFFIPRLES